MIRSLTSLPFFLFFKNHKILVQKTKQEKVTSTFILVFFFTTFSFLGCGGVGGGDHPNSQIYRRLIFFVIFLTY